MKRGRSTGKPTAAEADRIERCKSASFDWSKVERRSADECWPWVGRVNRWGYGDARVMGVRMNASRAAYLDHYGVIADGMVVCHRCDNPACCNPMHLFAATQAENLADCRAKGRARGQFAGGETHPRHTAKLTPEMVLEARRLYAEGVSQSEIGRRWGIHSSSISRAVRGEKWGYVK